MAAYVIVDVTITDPAAYTEYTKLVPATLAPFGGEFIVRGGKVEVAEGNWSPKRVVVLKFETAERAKAWLDSDAYGPVKAIRHRSATTNMIIVEGI